MLRRVRRPLATLIAVLLLPALAACGSNSSDAKPKSSSSSSASSALEEVSFTGKVGDGLTAKWQAKVATPKATKVTTIVKGTGDDIASGDTVSTYLWIGNGTTKKQVYSDYTNGKAESLPNNGQVSKVLDQLFKGATYGSRVAAVTTPAELLGSASAASRIGVGATDSLVVVADFVKKAAVSPTPSSNKVQDVPPGRQPEVVLKGGKPTGLNFAGIKKPSLTTPVQRVVLKQGKGKAVKASDTVTVNYLGATYRGKKPFDESFSKQPLTQQLSGLIPGWAIGLSGVKVGSRVLLQIPPAFGYGAEGSGSTIPGNATLWFVIDIVKVG